MFFFFCASSSLSRSSIYSIHYTYYSLAVSGLLSSFFMITFLFFSECALFDSFLFSKYNLVIFSLLCLYLHLDSSVLIGIVLVSLFFIVFAFLFSYACFYSCFFFMLVSFILPLAGGVFSAYLLCILAFILVFFLFMWINDLITECSFALTNAECYSLVSGIKLLILSEFMLFFCVFWCEINFSFLLSFWSCFNSMPLVNASSFSIPFSNVIILLFSSLPIQATIVFYKVGLFFSCIEQLGQAVSCGTCFLVLQLNEFLYSFHSLTDCMIGSIFYFTTGLHGAHVLFGLIYFYLILLCYVMFGLFVSSSFTLSTFNSTLTSPLTFYVASLAVLCLAHLNVICSIWFAFLSFIDCFARALILTSTLTFTFNFSFYSSSSLLCACCLWSIHWLALTLALTSTLTLSFNLQLSITPSTLLLSFNLERLILAFNSSLLTLIGGFVWAFAFTSTTLITMLDFSLLTSNSTFALTFSLATRPFFLGFSSWIFSLVQWPLFLAISVCAFYAAIAHCFVCIQCYFFFTLNLSFSMLLLSFYYYIDDWLRLFLFTTDILLITFNFIFYSFTFTFLLSNACNHISYSAGFKCAGAFSYALFFSEFNDSLLFSSYYWHFVDIIWLLVFCLFFY